MPLLVLPFFCICKNSKGILIPSYFPSYFLIISWLGFLHPLTNSRKRMTNCNICGIAGKLGQPASTGQGQPSALAWQQKRSAFCRPHPCASVPWKVGQLKHGWSSTHQMETQTQKERQRWIVPPTSSTLVSKITIICLILRISPPLTSPISGWSIPGPRSAWVSLWDDQGWQQRTQSFKVYFHTSSVLLFFVTIHLRFSLWHPICVYFYTPLFFSLMGRVYNWNWTMCAITSKMINISARRLHRPQ